MKLTSLQEMHLANLTIADASWRAGKIDAKAEARALIAKETAVRALRRDTLVRICFDANIPKAQIGLVGLRTSAPIAVIESLKRTEGISVQIATEQRPDKIERYTWTGAYSIYGTPVVCINMAGEDWDSHRAATKHKQRNLEWANMTTWDFSYNATTGGFGHHERGDNSTPNKTDHPISAWLKFYGGKAEITEWMNNGNPAPAYNRTFDQYATPLEELAA